MKQEQREQQKKIQEQLTKGFSDKTNPFNYGFIMDNYNKRKKGGTN